MALSRRTKWVLAVAAAFVLLGIVAHTPPTKELARRILVSAASSLVDGRVSIGSLDYQLWRAAVELDDVSVDPDLMVVPFTLTADRIELQLSLPLKLSGRLESPELVFIDFFETPATDYTPLLPYIGAVAVEDGAIRFRDHDDAGELEEWIAVEDLAIDLLEAGDEHRGVVHARGGHAFDVTFGAIDADVFLRVGHLRAASASIFKDDSFVRAAGELDFAGELEGELELDYALDGALARVIDDELDVVGVVSGTTRIDIVDGASKVDAELASPSLAWQNVVAEDIEAEAGYAAGTLTVRRVEARGFGGGVRLGAEITFEETATNRLELTWNGIDAADVVARLADETLPLATRLGGNATLSLTGWDLDTAVGVATVELEPGSDAVGRIEAALDAGVVSVTTDRVSVPELGTALDVGGTVTTAGEMALDVGVVVQDVAKVYERSPTALEGALTARGSVRGPLQNPRWSAMLASERLRIADGEYELSGNVTGSLAEASLDDVTLDGELGSIAAKGSLPLTATGAWNVDAAARGVAEGEVHVFGAATDPDWSAELGLTPSSAGRYALVARKEGRTIHVDELSGTLESASLTATGTYALDSEAIDSSLSVSGFRPSELAAVRDDLHGFDGVVTLDGKVSGTRRAPLGEVAVRVDELTYEGASLPSLILTVTGADERVRLEALRNDGAQVLTGDVRLSDDYPLHAEVVLDALPIYEISSTLPIFLERQRAQWTVAGVAVIDVPLAEPAALVYRADVESMELSFSESTARASSFTIEGDRERLRITNFDMRGDASALSIDGEIPLSDDARFDLRTAGVFDLDFLRVLQPNLAIAGVANLEAAVRGTFAEPDIEGTLAIENSSGSWHGIEWSELTLSAIAEEDRLRELHIDASVLGGGIELNGEIPFVEAAEPGRVEFRVVDVDIMPAANEGSAVVGVSGALDLPGPDPAEWSGSGEIGRFSARAATSAFDLAGPAQWRLEDGALSVPGLRLESERGALEVRVVSLGLTDGITIDASADGSVDIAFVNAFIHSPGTRVSGVLELDSAARTVDGALELTGQARLTEGRLVMVDPGFVLSEASAVLSLDHETVMVSELSARAGSGSLSGGGTVDLTELSRPVFNVSLDADDVPLELMDGLRAEVSGKVRLGTTGERLGLSANLSIDRGYVTRELDADDNSFSSQAMMLSDPTAEPGPLDELALDVIINTARNIRVENSTMQLELAGTLSIGGTIASPELDGFITVLRDGTFNIGRNKFQVVQGRIDITGFPAVPPDIELTAVTRVGTTLITVDLEGDLDDMRTRLTAPENPELTEGDLASLLVTGRTLENAGEGGQQMASTWMMSSLANLVHDGLGDLFSFGPAPGAGPLILSEEADPTSRLTLGFPVTERFSVTYSIALDSTERRLWILDYRIARNVWLRGMQENSNNYSFGLSQRFSLDFRQSPVATRAMARDQRIARVEVDGAPEGMGARIKLRTGERYDYWAAIDEAAKMETELVERGYRSAVVDVETDVEAAGDRDAVALRFRVNPGKPTEFVWRGDDPTKDVKKLVERSWAGRVPEDFLLSDVTRRALAELRSERYYLARVETSVEELDARRNIVFETTLGPRGKQAHLEFVGNEAVTDADLTEALPETDTPELFSLLERPAELERGIRLRYAADGYLDASVSAPESRYDAESGVFRIEIPVAEGPQTKIGSVSFNGDLSLESERLSTELGVIPGTPVDFPEIRRGQARLRTLYRNEGFPDVKVRAVLERTDDGLDVVVIVDEGGRARVGEVRIVGNRRTHPNVIRNELTFRANDPVRIIDFQATQRRLYDLGIFRSADVRPDPAQQGEEVQDIVIQVVERADLDVNYGVRYNVLGSEQSVNESETRSTGPELMSRINLVNQFGRGTNLGFSIFWQTKYQLYRTTFRMPTFLGKRIITELFADTERDEETLGVENFDTRSRAVTFQQTKKLTDNRREKFALQWNFRYGRFRSMRFDPNEGVLREIDTYRPRFGTSLIDDRRDSFANPTRGRFWNITVQVVPEIWGSDVGYVRLYGQFFYYYPITKSIVWASGVRMGFAKGSKELLLMEDRFLAGGANSVRGFKQNSLGPSVFIEETQERVFIGGQAVGVYNQELRFPIWKALHGGVFWDTGNVFTLANQFRLSDLRHSIGAGIRFVLPFGAIRFDYAEAINARPEDETTRFHFSFGYAF